MIQNDSEWFNISSYLLDSFTHHNFSQLQDRHCWEVQAGYTSSSILFSLPKELSFMAFELSRHDKYAVSLNFVLRKFSLSSFKAHSSYLNNEEAADGELA